MEFLYCQGGASFPLCEEYDIVSTTVVKAGQPVKQNLNRKIIVGSYENIGIAAENHSGAYDALDPRQNGTKIRVYTSPDAVYKLYAPIVKFAASGSTAVKLKVATSLPMSSTNYENYAIVLLKKAVGSTNTDEIGKVRLVSSSVVTSSVLYFNVESGGIPDANDEYALVPGIGRNNVTTSDGIHAAVGASDNTFICVGRDTSFDNIMGLPTCFVKLRNHVFNTEYEPTEEE